MVSHYAIQPMQARSLFIAIEVAWGVIDFRSDPSL